MAGLCGFRSYGSKQRGLEACSLAPAGCPLYRGSRALGSNWSPGLYKILGLGLVRFRKEFGCVGFLAIEFSPIFDICYTQEF